MSYQFVNPYNFIPLSGQAPDRKPAGAEAEDETLFTGEIKYSVLTKTPIFIPNTSCENMFGSNVEGHKSYDFFSYHDLSDEEERKNAPYVPVIPGSEIRGLIRSNYEILTNSCLSSLDSDNVMSKRTRKVLSPGLIRRKEDGTYDLYDAEDCLLRTKSSDCLEDDDWEPNDTHFSKKSYIQKDLSEGQKVWFKKKTRRGKSLVNHLTKDKTKKGQEGRNSEGYVLKGNDGPVIERNGENDWKAMKHCCHVFAYMTDQPVVRNISLDILQTVIDEYGKNKETKMHYTVYDAELKKFMNGEMEQDSCFPVYYDKVDEIGALYLSPASITREIYERTLGEIAGPHKTCSKKEKLCPACRLFGMLGKGKDAFAVTSRLRFSDLEFQGSMDKAREAYLEPVTLQPLSSPKLNNMEFYLKRPEDAVFWTYDYYVDQYDMIRKNESGINGRKFYWHDMSTVSGNLRTDEPTQLNVTVRPLEEKQTFSGSIYFEKLTREELNSLIYTVNTGEKGDIKEKEHGYKLGHAKPLGLGSVALHVDSVSIRVYQSDEHGISRKIKDYEEYQPDELPGLIDRDVLENFQIMTAFNAVEGKNIDYPRRQNGGDIFDWFVQNHKGYKNKNGIRKSLESPSKEIQEYYREYMIPLQTELGRIDVGINKPVPIRTFSTESASDGKNNGKSAMETDFEAHKKYIAEVTGYRNDDVILKTEDGREVSINFRQLEKIEKGARKAQDIKKGRKFEIFYRKITMNGPVWEATKG